MNPAEIAAELEAAGHTDLARALRERGTDPANLNQLIRQAHEQGVVDARVRFARRLRLPEPDLPEGHPPAAA